MNAVARPSRRWIPITQGLLLGCAVATTAWLLSSGQRLDRKTPPVPAPRPARSLAAVDSLAGSESCKTCHPDESASFRSSPMGRSIRDVADPSLSALGRNPVVLPAGFPFRYAIETSADGIHCTEAALNPLGKEVYRQSEKLAFAIGSGAHAVTFTITHPDGAINESPLTWYRQELGWSMSPGFEKGDHRRFQRPIQHECLFCHSGYSRPVPGTISRYDPEHPFVESAISCERCHGPGKAHVAFHESKGSPDPPRPAKMVDPSRLATGAGNDVCLQCHRTGSDAIDVLRPGMHWENFRPGMRIEEVVDRFRIQPLDAIPGKAGVHFTGKMSQLARSSCFIRSEGKLGCLTCHLVHGSRDPEHLREHHRNACLSCHDSGDCGVEPAERARQRPNDDCAECHMPVIAPSDVPRTTITDHWIRMPGKENGEAAAKSAPPELIPYSDVVAASPSRTRSLGIAYGILGKGFPRPEALHRRAVDLLRESQPWCPDDLEHRLALGRSLSTLGDRAGATEAFTSAIRIDPASEDARVALARELFLAGRWSDAIGPLRDALQIDPRRVELLVALGRIHAERGELQEARGAFESARRVSPGSRDAAIGLAQVALKEGKRAESEDWVRLYHQLPP